MANGTSDPNISLSANVLDPKRSSRIRGKYKLARDIRKSDSILRSSAEQAQEQNEAAADSSFWGRLTGAGIGTAAGLGLGALLAIPTGGASLALAAAGAGVGSYAGSKVGEERAGGIDTDVESGGFQMDKVSELNKELASYAKGVEEDRMMNAASDAFSIYMAGGGGLKPGSIGSGTGVFSSTSQYSKFAPKMGRVLEGGKQLVSGGVSNYAKKRGLGTTYEEYLKRNKV